MKLLVMLLFACATETSTDLAEQDPDAALYSAKGSSTAGGNWSGEWTPRLWAADPQHPNVVAIKKRLGTSAKLLLGEIQAPRGTVDIVYLPAAQKPPAGSGERVLVLGPGWSTSELAKLSRTGSGIVQAEAEIKGMGDPKHLRDPTLFAALAVTPLSAQYSLPLNAATQAAKKPSRFWPMLGYRPNTIEKGDPFQRIQAANDPDAAEMLVRLSTAIHSNDNTSLEQLSSDTDPWVRARALSRVRNTELIWSHHDDPSSLVRVVVADRIARLAATQSLQKELRLLANSPDAYVRWKAAYGLGLIHHPSIETLLTLLKDSDIDVAREAARSLGRRKNKQALPALKQASLSDNSFLRRWAYDAIGALATTNDAGFLKQRLQLATDGLERVAISKALEKIGVFIAEPPFQPPKPPRSFAEIDVLINSPSATIRKDCAKFLSGRKDTESRLDQLYLDADSEVRKSAIEAMARNNHPNLIRGLQDSDPDVLVTTLDGLRRSKVTVVDGLIPFLDHPDAELRLRAAEALAASKSATLYEAQFDRLYRDKDERIRAAVAAHVNPQDDEPSAWVRAQFATSPHSWFEQWWNGSQEDQAYIRGVIEREDQFLHELLSWNEDNDRPPSHRRLMPPQFSAYGRPDRG